MSSFELATSFKASSISSSDFDMLPPKRATALRASIFALRLLSFICSSGLCNRVCFSVTWSPVVNASQAVAIYCSSVIFSMGRSFSSLNTDSSSWVFAIVWNNSYMVSHPLSKKQS